MNKSQPLIFFGTEDFSAVSLEALLDGGFTIAAVVTKPDHKAGRGQKLTAPKVKQIAAEHGIEVWQPNSLNDISDKISSVKPRFGVLVSYGKIIPKRILDLFDGGIINVHPSLLPLARGPSPIESVILNDDAKTGVSLMKLVEKMDAGPIYASQEFGLSGQETKPQLYRQLASLGAELLVDKLAQIIDGSLPPAEQNESGATYSQLLKKHDGLIDWTKPASDYEREVRAYLGFPKSSATIQDYPVIITGARVAESADDGTLVMPCLDSFIEVIELIAPSGHRMSGEAFLAGHPERN